MSILLTGKSGFLGQIIYQALADNKIKTVGRSGCDITFDIREIVSTLPKVDIVIHAAGKAHSIPKTKIQKQEFNEINVDGTKNLMTSLERSGAIPKSFIFISSVAVYGKISGTLITEEHPLNAVDPYGLSKIQAEKEVMLWCQKHGVTYGILRLPLIAGANPPGNLGDMIKGINLGYYFNIGGGLARKSVVLATDVAKVISTVARVGGIYNLTDRKHPNFSELSQLIADQLNKSKPKNMPLWAATLIAKLGNLLGSKSPLNTVKLSKIISDLTFDDSRAVQKIAWNPAAVIDNFKIK